MRWPGMRWPGMRWRKVLGDLRESRARLALVAVAIALGTLATAVAVGARAVLAREVPASYLRARPASAVLWLDSVPPALVHAVRRRPGVVDAEARRLVRARVEVASGDWRPLLLYAVPDFRDQRVGVVRLEGRPPERGMSWPPPAGTALVERSAIPVLRPGTRSGSTAADSAVPPRALHIRLPGGQTADLPVAGVVHDAGQAPGWQDNAAYAYASPATLAQLGQGAYLDELRLRVQPTGRGPEADRREAARIAAGVESWLGVTGRPAQRVEVPLREHPHTPHMWTMVALLTLFGGLALLLAGALTATVLAAVLARHVRQVGILKTLGARTRDVTALYLGLVLAVALPAVAVALPLGAGLARAFARFAAAQLNLDVASLAIPAGVIAAEAGLGLAVPLVAAWLPIRRAARMTARAAIADAGPPLPTRTPGRSGGRQDRLGVLAFRNLFRRPVRLWLTAGALAAGGAVLMTAVNVYRGLTAAVDRALDQRGDDLDVRLLRPAPAAALVARVRAVPGVTTVEAWGHALAAVALPAASPGDSAAGGADASGALSTGRYALLAPPADTRLLRLPVAEGRWLRPGEAGAVVVDRGLQAREPALRVGAAVTLVVASLGGVRRLPVRVVGAVEAIEEPSFYTTPATLTALTGFATASSALVDDSPGVAGALRVVTAPGVEARVATAVEAALVDAGAFPVYAMTRPALRRAMTDHFLILLALLSAVAATSLVVGALSLATSVSLTVLERAREIGVMRAIGARRGSILRVLLLEAGAVAGLSAALAVVAAVPLTAAVGSLVGTRGLHVALPLVIAPAVVAGWLLLAAAVAALACVWPARAALRPAVRDVLAYE